VEGSCEHGNAPTGSINSWEVIEWLHNWHLLKKGSAPWVSEWQQIYVVHTHTHTQWNFCNPKWLTVPSLPKNRTTKGSEFESRWGQEFSLLHIVQTGSGAQPAYNPMGVGGYFPGVKRLGREAGGREADHSPPTGVEVKKMWTYTFTSPYVIMA
jgi:hypothetical protein